jgi:acetylornithine deacetylase/succinyl-diaminopimelate desuccinylase-like protein
MVSLKEVHDYVDLNTNSHLRGLQDFVKLPSVSVEREGTQECAEFIRQWMKDIGFQKAELYNPNGNPTIYGEYHSSSDSEKTLLLYGAYDSNPVEEEKWQYPPYAGVIVEKPGLGKCLVARGVNNKMKVTGILNAVSSFREVSGDIPVNLIVAIDGEEEMFSPGLPNFVSKYADTLKTAHGLYMPFSSQNSKGTARVQLGYKGVCYLELSCSSQTWNRGPESEIHSMHRAAVDNPVWYLIHALASMTTEEGNRVAIKGFGNDIVPPEPGFMGLVESLAEGFDVESYKEGLGVSSLMMDETDPLDVLKRLFFTSQINIDGIWGGYIGEGAEAVVPPEAKVKLDIRLIPEQKPEKVRSLIETHLTSHGFTGIHVEELAAVETCLTSVDDEIAQSLVRAYDSVGVHAQIWPSSLATIPIYVFNQLPLGLPFATGCVGFGGHTHGNDEYFVVEGEGGIQGIAGYEKVIASVIHYFGESNQSPDSGASS